MENYIYTYKLNYNTRQAGIQNISYYSDVIQAENIIC